MINRGDLLVAHTMVELRDGTEVTASWFFTPGSVPITSGPVESCDPGSGSELVRVEMDGYGSSDCSQRLLHMLGVEAYRREEERAMEVAERSGPDPDDLREQRMELWAERQRDADYAAEFDADPDYSGRTRATKEPA